MRRGLQAPLHRICNGTYVLPPAPRRPFSSSKAPRTKEETSAKVKSLNQKSFDKHEGGVRSQTDDKKSQVRERQMRTPWHREGSDMPPVRRQRSAGAMTKGKLLSTPSKLLKLIFPLTTLDKNDDRKTIEPLALVIHPQQPLSYLERLIQSELPILKRKDGKDKIPDVFFRAEDSTQEQDSRREAQSTTEDGSENTMIDGELVKVGKVSNGGKKSDGGARKSAKDGLRGGPGEGGVESYSGMGREASSTPGEPNFVRWSSSTEIGDFIRDAARGKEFVIEIEGESEGIHVGVPSFSDRTHYLRVRLQKFSRRLEDMAKVKKECDDLAHKSAQRIAVGGFGILAAWWAGIYHFTFQTSYGWDTMEPITYLASLSSIMTGYLWFLYHNREVSYRSALNLTVSRRQSALYAARGFDLPKWESMIEEANALRKEIKSIASEYDVEWDEKLDEVSGVVHQAMKKERAKERKKESMKDEGEEEGDEGDEGDDMKEEKGRGKTEKSG